MMLKIQTEVECPSVPNFIKTKRGETVSIGDFTDDQLRTVGEYWTMQLLRAAEKNRKNLPIADFQTTNQEKESDANN